MHAKMERQKHQTVHTKQTFVIDELSTCDQPIISECSAPH